MVHLSVDANFCIDLTPIAQYLDLEPLDIFLIFVQINRSDK